MWGTGSDTTQKMVPIWRSRKGTLIQNRSSFHNHMCARVFFLHEEIVGALQNWNFQCHVYPKCKYERKALEPIIRVVLLGWDMPNSRIYESVGTQKTTSYYIMSKRQRQASHQNIRTKENQFRKMSFSRNFPLQALVRVTQMSKWMAFKFILFNIICTCCFCFSTFKNMQKLVTVDHFRISSHVPKVSG